MDKKTNAKKIRKEKDVVMEESSRSRSNNLRKTYNNKRSSRNKSSSNCPTEADPQSLLNNTMQIMMMLFLNMKVNTSTSLNLKMWKLKNENEKIKKFEEEITWSWFR